MRLRTGWLFVSFYLLALRPLHAAPGDRPLVSKALPVYPVLARRMHVFGEIHLFISILPSGAVDRIVLRSGHPLLVEAARDAVRHWKFAAAPQTTTTSVVVHFDLPE